jgi:hypothetical protein
MARPTRRMDHEERIDDPGIQLISASNKPGEGRQIGAGCAAVRRAVGPVVFEVSVAQMVAACSGGWLLGRRAPTIGGLSINTCPRL